jgi:hypothetical protein
MKKFDEMDEMMEQVDDGLSRISGLISKFFDDANVQEGSVQEFEANGISVKTMIKDYTITLWVNGEKVYERDVKKDGKK